MFAQNSHLTIFQLGGGILLNIIPNIPLQNIIIAHIRLEYSFSYNLSPNLPFLLLLHLQCQLTALFPSSLELQGKKRGVFFEKMIRTLTSLNIIHKMQLNLCFCYFIDLQCLLALIYICSSASTYFPISIPQARPAIQT